MFWNTLQRVVPKNPEKAFHRANTRVHLAQMMRGLKGLGDRASTAASAVCCGKTRTRAGAWLLLLLHSLGEDFAIEVALRAAQGSRADGGLALSVILIALGCVQFRPRWQALAIRVARLRKVGEVGLDQVGEMHVNRAEVACDIAGRGELAKNVGQLC